MLKKFKFFEGEGSGGGTPPTTIPVVTPTNEAVTDHTIQHAEKISALEGRLSQQESDFYRRLQETQDQLQHAIEDGGKGQAERITQLEAKIEAMVSNPPTPENKGVPFTPPDPEPSKVPPEKMSRGMRARRLQRKAGNK